MIYDNLNLIYNDKFKDNRTDSKNEFFLQMSNKN